jgi:hypothetical protein
MIVEPLLSGRQQDADRRRLAAEIMMLDELQRAAETQLHTAALFVAHQQAKQITQATAAPAT